MPDQRELRFSNLQEAKAEVERLSSAPCRTTGTWSYFQILEHLAESIEDSYKLRPGRVIPAIDARATEILFKRLKRNGKLQPGAVNPALPQTRQEGDEKAAAARLLKAIQDFGAATELLPEPQLGRLNHEQYEFLHTIHCALHLSFVHPL